LNYNFGTLSEWKKLLTSPKTISSCSTTILHGTYDQGYNPSATLLNSPSSAMAKIYALHQGLTATDKDTSQCGRPQTFTPNGGIVLDSWYFTK